MRLVTRDEPISRETLLEMSTRTFGNLVKAVVDLRLEVMAVDSELHSDEEAILVEKGSDQTNLWGINFYPEIEGEDWIEFDSMINIRPTQGNRSRSVEDPMIQRAIREIVERLVT